MSGGQQMLLSIPEGGHAPENRGCRFCRDACAVSRILRLVGNALDMCPSFDANAPLENV
jgi:hypothetical protein